MNRRQFIRATVAAGSVSVAGCRDTGTTDGTARTSGSADTDACATTTAGGGPQSGYDSLSLYEMPDYVTEYESTVVVAYDELGVAAKRAVDRALEADDAYRECSLGGGRTDVMALFGAIEGRWQATGGESFDHTYLRHDGRYYGITLVQEGDFIRVKSIPCRQDACPATPTPPE